MKDELSVREIQITDIDANIRYWLDSDAEYLLGLGVDLSKMPSKDEWIKMLSEQLNRPYPEKTSYCMIWLVNGKPIGHSNINKIRFAEEAYMHLHIWDREIRKKGYGTELIKLTVPYFFNNYQLKRLFCEPYALNDAPNKTLSKAGFEFVRRYVSVPGYLNFEQPVNLWVLSAEVFKNRSASNVNA